jgi:hypothetical protein
VNPQTISDVYNRICLEPGTPKSALENYKALRQSGAFDCAILDAIAVAEAIAASIFHLGLAVGERLAAARLAGIVESGECQGPALRGGIEKEFGL